MALLRISFIIVPSSAVPLIALLAHAATVAVVRPATSPPAVVEMLVRLQGELTSVGFESQIIDTPASDSRAGPGGASDSWRDGLTTRPDVDAVIAIGPVLGDEVPASIEVHVVDKVTGRWLVKRLSREPQSQRPPDTLAIRAVELLRSTLLEMALAASARRAASAVAPPDTVVHVVEPGPLAGWPERFEVEAGAAATATLDGVGPALSPLGRVTWALDQRWAAQLTAAGLGTHPTVDGTIGSARVIQDYGIVGARYRFRSHQRLRPLVALSAGALHTAVDGQAQSPNQGRHAERWSLLLDASLGAQLRIAQRFFFTAAAHLQIAEPYLAVRFADRVVATSGRPNVLLTLTIGAWM
ncbi:MAG TPA: hypothetical protein VGP07_24270 [Polyangia bacterium]